MQKLWNAAFVYNTLCIYCCHCQLDIQPHRIIPIVCCFFISYFYYNRFSLPSVYTYIYIFCENAMRVVKRIIATATTCSYLNVRCYFGYSNNIFPSIWLLYAYMCLKFVSCFFYCLCHQIPDTYRKISLQPLLNIFISVFVDKWTAQMICLVHISVNGNNRLKYAKC